MQDKPITSLRGIGAARAEAFAKLGVKTVGDLLYLLPRSFQDFSKERLAAELSHGELAAVRVRIISEPKLARFRGHSVVTARATDGVSNVLLNGTDSRTAAARSARGKPLSQRDASTERAA